MSTVYPEDLKDNHIIVYTYNLSPLVYIKDIKNLDYVRLEHDWPLDLSLPWESCFLFKGDIAKLKLDLAIKGYLEDIEGEKHYV